jgi:formimidoylglutamate deiminase
MTKLHVSHFFQRALIGRTLRHGVRLDLDGDGTITAVACDAAPRPHDRCHDLALPGMPNVHSHAHQYALAGRTERSSDKGDNFWGWREAMYRFAGRMTPDQFRSIATQLYVDLLKGGYTSVGEFQYVHHNVDGAPYAEPALMSQQALLAAHEAGIGMTILPVLYRYSDFGDAAPTREQRRFVNTADSYLRIVAALADSVRDHPLQRVGLAPHSLRAVNGELLTRVLAGSPLPDEAPIHIHVAEQTREVDDATRVLRRRPVEYLFEHFDINTRWCLVHATHLTDAETDRLATSGAVAGLCPSTEANLGDGLFRALRYCRGGGQIAIGSDSNVATDAAGELRLLEYGQRLQHRARNLLAAAPGSSTGQDLLHRAQRGGARALAQPVGALTAGARADFITLKINDPQLTGRGDDMLDSYVFGAGARALRDVYVAGRRVIHDGHHAHEDRILKSCRDTLEELT